MPIHVRSKRSAPRKADPPAGAARNGGLLFGLPQAPAERHQLPPGISLCMIVKNEERFLEQCLNSVADVVDETIVVDTGSTDRTVEIARRFGATVIRREWRDDFGWARNQALEAATKRWILVLDADEELMPASKASLRRLKDVPAHETAIWTRLYNKSDDYRGTGEMSHALIRVFPNNPEIRYRGLIHEFATLRGDPNGLRGVQSPIGILHHGYVKEVVSSRDKGARNLAIVKAAAQREPEEAYHWFNLGATAFLVEDYATARDALERMRSMLAGQDRGFLPNGLAVLAETYCDKFGDAVKGEEAARAALAVAPHYANAHFQLGKALVAQGRYDEAREAYLGAIDDGKYAAQQYVIDDQVYIWKAHCEIGSSYVMQKDDAKAVEWFEKGLKNAPGAEPLQINRAKALERLGRVEEARQAFRTVYELYRGEQAAIEYVNHLLRNHAEYETLAIVDESYASMAPERAVPLLMAAAAVCQRHGSTQDERYLREAASLAPGSADVLNGLEAVLIARGKSADLEPFLERERSVAPKTAADHLRRARKAISQGHFAEGRELAAAGLESEPSDAALAHALALAQASLGDHSAALTTLDRIREGNAQIIAAMFTLRSSVLRSLGRIAEARDCADRATAVDAGWTDAWMLKATLAQESGDDAECESSLRRAFALDSKRAALSLSSFYLQRGRLQDAAAVADTALQAAG